jgi:PAS domain S-box-containing protein
MQVHQLKILIVDDHEVIRRALRSLLQSRPEWTVCGEAADGAEALEATRLQRPDVVLMDISMPGMDGVQLTRALRLEHPDVRVLIVSQNDPQITRSQAEIAGAAGYVAKADISRRLLAAIDEIVGPENGSSARAGAQNKAAEEESRENRTPWLDGGGQMDALIRTKDWRETPLGPLEEWPESLKLSTSICVSSRFDMIVWWGSDLIMLYNDSYRRTLGAKHPFALGQPGHLVYPEIWDVIGPMLNNVMSTGEATWSADLMLLLERSGYPEETYHTFSCTPIRNALGKIVGVITPVTETTQKVISERRLLTLRDLAARSVDAKNEKEAWEFAAQALGANPYDISAAVLYKASEDSSKLESVARAGVGSDDPFFADAVELAGAEDLLAVTLRKALRTRKPVELNETSKLPLSSPGGFWGVVPAELIVLPISQTGREKALGALLVGANRHKKLDDDYRGFLGLVSGQIARSIADARVLDQERQRAKALAEERLNMALELGRMGTWDLDLETGREYWSPTFFEMLGYRPGEEEACSDAWAKRVHPKDLPEVLQAWEGARTEGRDFRLEYRICLPDGETRWLETSGRFFRDGAGNAYRVLGVSRDITPTKQTEEVLRHRGNQLIRRVRGQKSALQRSSEEVARQAELLDLANDAAFISDHHGRITYWNRGAERLYGWRKEEATGQNSSALLQTEFPISRQEVLQTMQQKGVWEGELQQTTRYGHRITVASRWTCRRDNQGAPNGWLEINSDLTLQKQSQEAARRLSARILKVQDEERRKVARELHDSLGQYLASLKVNISASLRTVQSESIRQMLTECAQLLDQCLSETRTISYLLHPPLLDETGLASPIRWYVEGFAKRSGIEVSLHIPATIPRFTNEIETAVFRILQESLTNAHRHAKTPRVEIGIQVAADTVVLSVRDYGSGIPPKLLRSFMDRNERVGVGLAGMRERARELGGLMTVMPADDGPGTIVAVEIPIVRRESADFDSGDPGKDARAASVS